MRKQTVVILFFLLGSLPLLTAQSTATEQVIYALFNQAEKIEWCRHYHGRVDDFNEVAVSLAYDGKKCKGLMTYLRSKEAVQLEGVIKNNLINLKEIDREGAVSAYIKGELRKDEVFAEWTNFDESVAGIIHLQEVEKEVETPSYCGENMWIRHYEGQLSGDRVPMIIQRVEEGQLRGIAYLEKEGKSYRLRGEIDEFSNFHLYLQNEDYRLAGVIKGKLDNITTPRVLFQKNQEEEAYLLLRLKSSLYMGCVEYADYLSSYDITFPKTTNEKFNNWMNGEVEDWVSFCTKYAKSVRAVNQELKPPHRSSVRAYGWTDVDYLSDKVISGFITFDDTWSFEPQGRAFNFDLKNGKEIFYEDLFKKDFNVNKFVGQYLKDHMNQFSWSQDEKYRQWLSGKDFPHFTIREEGICFGTDFSMRYGRHEMTIPYEVLKPFIKKRSPIAVLIN